MSVSKLRAASVESVIPVILSGAAGNVKGRKKLWKNEDGMVGEDPGEQEKSRVWCMRTPKQPPGQCCLCWSLPVAT